MEEKLLGGGTGCEAQRSSLPRGRRQAHLPFPACQPLVPLALADVVGVPGLEGEPRHGPLAKAGLPAQATPKPAPGALGQRHSVALRLALNTPLQGWGPSSALPAGETEACTLYSRQELGVLTRELGKLILRSYAPSWRGPSWPPCWGLPNASPTSSPPLRGAGKEEAGGTRGLLTCWPRLLRGVSMGGWLSPASIGPHGAPRDEESTCLHFHGLDVGLLLFFACGEGRTKALWSAERLA